MKKFVVMLANIMTLKAGHQYELEAADADQLIKDAKAIELKNADPSQRLRDHSQSPGVEDAIGDAVAKILAPLQKQLEGQAKTIGELQAKLDAQIEAAKSATKPTTHTRGIPGTGAPVNPITGKLASEGTGISHVRILKAVGMAYRSKGAIGGEKTVDQVLSDWGYKDELDALKRQREASGFARERALGASILTDGGSLIPEVFSSDIIQLLRNETAVRQLGYRQMDLGAGNLTIGRQSSASTAAYIAEGAVITPSKPGTDQVKLSAKKLASLVVVSNDLLRQASISAEEFVRADLLAVMSLREDVAFIRGDGTSDTPKGLRNDTNSNNIYAATAVAPKVPTLAEVRAELAKAKYTLAKNNVKVDASRLAWIISPRTRYYLELLQDGNGNTAIFATELAQRRLWGIPFVDTTQIPDNLGGGTDESEIYLYRTDEFMIGDHMQMEVTVEPNGAYEEGGVAKAGLSRDETPIRVLSAHDSKLRHNISAVVVTTVRWGAP